jgi:hypothetical protein
VAGILIALKFALMRHSGQAMRLVGLLAGIAAVGATWS